MPGRLPQTRPQRRHRIRDAREPELASQRAQPSFPLPLFRYTLVLLLFIPAGSGLYMLYVDGVEILNEFRLQGSGVETDARVTERGDGLFYFEVRYAFSPLNVRKTYSHADPFEKDAWTMISEAEWRASEASGQIQVLYLPDNPAINRPLNPERAPTTVYSLGFMFTLLWAATPITLIVLLFLSARP